MIGLVVAGALWTALSVAGAEPVSATDERVTLLVLDPEGDDDDRRLRAELAAAVARVAADDERARVYSAADVTRIAALAVNQQLSGCESQACLAEIGDALGAGYVVFGTLRTVAGQRRLELSLSDVASGEIVARGAAVARDKAALLDETPALARTLLSTVLPPPPLWSRPLVVAGVVTAGAGVVVGAAGGVGAFVFDATAADPTSSGADKATAVALGPPALVMAAVGVAALVVGGVVVGVGALD